MTSFLKILKSACAIIGAFVICFIIFSLSPLWLDITLCTAGILVSAIAVYLKSDYRKKNKVAVSRGIDDTETPLNPYERIKEHLLTSKDTLGRFRTPIEDAYLLKHGSFKSEDNIKIPLDVQTIARHEAGHAIVARECGFLVASIYVSGANERGHVSAHFDPSSTDAPQEMQFKAALIRHAGLLAEDNTTTSIVGHMPDFMEANALILGLTATTERTFQEISDNIREVGLDILQRHQETHEKLTHRLIEKYNQCDGSFEFLPQKIADIIGPQVGEIVFDENMVARYVMP